jgi:hypothetical protein
MGLRWGDLAKPKKRKQRQFLTRMTDCRQRADNVVEVGQGCRPRRNGTGRGYEVRPTYGEDDRCRL